MQIIIHKVFLYDTFNYSCLLAFIGMMIKMNFNVNQSSKAKMKKKINKCIYYWIVISIKMKIHIHALISLVLYLCT